MVGAFPFRGLPPALVERVQRPHMMLCGEPFPNQKISVGKRLVKTEIA
jgi:hypothetical protein